MCSVHMQPKLAATAPCVCRTGRPLRVCDQLIAQRAQRLQVTDRGIGIDASFEQDLFASFTQAAEARTRHHGGLGLGLAICKHLADLMKAELSVRNNDRGRGATASLRLQLPTTPEAQAPNAGVAPQVERCCAALWLRHDATRRQLESHLTALGVLHVDAPSLHRSACEHAAQQRSGGAASALVLICARDDVTAALQHGWKRHPVMAVCVDEPVPHALRLFAASLTMPLQHQQLASALAGAVSGGSDPAASLAVPLGAPKAAQAGTAAAACTAGFGGKACGYCGRCQAAVEESFELVVRSPRCAVSVLHRA